MCNNNNRRKVQSIINQVIDRTECLKTGDKYMCNDRVVTDSQTTADGFNNYFVNIGPGVAYTIQITIFHAVNSYLKI